MELLDSSDFVSGVLQTILTQDTFDSVVEPRNGEACSLYRINPDVLVDIMSYLSPLDLCAVASVAHPLRSLINIADGIVWRGVCTQLWRSKQGFRGHCEQLDVALSCYRSNAGTHLTVRDVTSHRRAIKKQEPSVQLSPFTTLQCIQARILPQETSAAKQVPPAVLQLPPPSIAPSSGARRRYWWELSPAEQARRLRRLLAPADALSQSSSDDDAEQEWTLSTCLTGQQDASPTNVTWKFAYFQSLRDVKRNALGVHDLMHGKWTIAFRQIPNRTFPARFDADGVLHTPLHSDGFPYHLSQQGAELNVHVFPTLKASRNNVDGATSDWGWRISNYFVNIESEELPTPAYLQFLQLRSCIRPP